MENLDGDTIVTPETDNSQEPLEDLTKERYKQQMAWSRAEVERYQQEAEKSSALVEEMAINAAKSDGNHLLELHAKDPALAERVALKGFNMSIDEVKAYMNWWTQWVPEKPSDDFETKFEAEYQKRLQSDQHTSAIQTADTIFDKLPEDIQQEAKDKFAMLSEWRKLTPQQATEYAEMATLYVSRGNAKANVTNEYLKSLSSTPSWSKAVAPTEWDEYIISGRQFIRKSSK